MSFDAEFLELMPHEISVRHRTSGRNKNGDPNLGSAVLYQCRVVGKILSTRSPREEGYTPIFTIYVGRKVSGGSLEMAVFTPEDELTLPDQTTFGDGKAVIFSVSRLTDEDGHHHVVLSCGWQYHRQGTVS